jgi:hypothetical protein
MDLHVDVSTPASYLLSDESTTGEMYISGTQIHVGDTFNFDKLVKTNAYGTLTIASDLDNDNDSSLSITDSTLVFDLTNLQSGSDKLIIKGFDNINFDRDTFVINGKGAVKGQTYTLIDFQDGSPTLDDLHEFSHTVKLVGIKGAISYDEASSDVVFTVA